MEFKYLEKTNYRIAGKFGEFDELSVICQTKTIQINNLLADLLICQTFPPAKLSHYTVYGIFHGQVDSQL